MTPSDVVELYRAFEHAGIKVWVDGGWSVDAVLGRQLRQHNDLDIAVQWKDVPALRELMAWRARCPRCRIRRRWSHRRGHPVPGRLAHG
jgi:lincosamide nucleotidyltransferase A/C/D/E